MSKKQKRQVARGNGTAAAEKTTRSNGTAVAEKPARSVSTRVAERKPVSTFSPSKSFMAAEFNPDYSHVVSDLKRIGILAGSFVVILVVLSFFLH